MYKIAVMGDYDSIYGFAALGLTTFPVDMDGDMEEAAKELRTIAASDYGVIYITEALAAKLKKEIDRYADQLLPAIILIPGVSGNTGAGWLCGIFAIPGIGRLATQAIQNRDMPLLQGTILFTTVLVILGNLAADLLYSVMDPRIRRER